jgi:hypothetical protein
MNRLGDAIVAEPVYSARSADLLGRSHPQGVNLAGVLGSIDRRTNGSRLCRPALARVGAMTDRARSTPRAVPRLERLPSGLTASPTAVAPMPIPRIGGGEARPAGADGRHD